MHFIVPDISNQNECSIKDTLQWLKYSTGPNGATPNTEKSQTFKIDWNPFYRLFSIMTDFESMLALSQKNDS